MVEAELGAASGVEVRDPTLDEEVVSMALSAPTDMFVDPETGTQRWIGRQLLAGMIPDQLRTSTRRGRQAADLVLRLRSTGEDVFEALDDLDRGPAADYVDVPRMREAWQRVQVEDSPSSLALAAVVVCRGIMAGLAVNQFA